MDRGGPGRNAEASWPSQINGSSRRRHDRTLERISTRGRHRTCSGRWKPEERPTAFAASLRFSPSGLDSSRCRRPCRVALWLKHVGDGLVVQIVVNSVGDVGASECRRWDVAQTRARVGAECMDSVGVARPDTGRCLGHRLRRFTNAAERAPRRHANCHVPLYGRLLRGLRDRQLPRDRRRRRSAADPTSARRTPATEQSGSRFR